MKQKLTVTVDAELIPVAKRHARSRGVSLSSLIEQSLREITGEDGPTFSSRWRGKFQAAEKGRRPALQRIGPEISSMMLLDTDVLVDIAFDRRPHSGPASELLDRIEYGAEAAYVAWHSISNLYYMVTPTRGGLRTRDFIVELTRFVAVAITNSEDIHYAAELPMADFEDAMQVAAARACGARHIVTRNIRDYERSPIRAVNPEEALGGLF